MLIDLFKKIEKVELRSVGFHQAQGDFERWIKDVIGDEELALRIGRIPQSIIGEPLRAEILREIRSRMYQFRVNLPS